MNFDHDSPSRPFSGAARSVGRRSTRSNNLPYNRPSNGMPSPAPFGGDVNGMATPTRNTPVAGRSGSATLPRSGSQLFSGIKTMFSRPLNWLATPSREATISGVPASSMNKRDQASFDADPEDPSPSRIRASKRARKTSPGRADPYAPAEPMSDFAALPSLPTLPSNVSLSARRQTFAAPGAYLDPPRSLLAPSSPSVRGRRPRPSAMSSFGHDEEVLQSTPAKPSAADAWSPWKESKSVSRRQSTLPSMSPFRPAGSVGPALRAPSTGLGRSSTFTNLAREASIAASDVSMSSGRGSQRLRVSSWMHDQEDEDESQMGTPRARPAAAAAAVSRLTPRAAQSAASQPTRIRKGQMVWDADKGFVRASEFEADLPKPVHQNDAERILAALESMRKPHRIDATGSRPATGLPASLVGSSSRTLRKAIAVPLATAQAENAKRTKRHGSEWLGENTVSAMISPYGRRRAIDNAVREERRERRRREESEASDIEVDASSRSRSGSRLTRSRSAASDAYLSDDHMSVSRASTSSRRSVSPQPARRSARIKAKSPAPEETPKLRRSTRKGTTPEPAPRTTRTRARKQTSPIPADREKTPEPAPPVPVLITTAASPSTATDGYQVRDDNDGPRARSSLRAGAERKHRSHQGAASYASSRATTPSGGAGGRFSARDEDLPEMDELDAAKIPLTSFKGISMPLFGAPAPAAEKKVDAPKESTPPLLSSRISAPAPAPAPQPTSSLSIPSSTVGRGSLNRLGSGLSNRPRASSPLASSSITAEPDSPQSQKNAPPPPKSPQGGFFTLAAAAPVASLSAPGSTTPAGKPPAASSFFAPPAKPTSLGLGKPPSPEGTPAPSGDIPSFFGSASSTPPPTAPKLATLDFGVSTPPAGADAPKAAVGGFSFGASANGSTAPAAKPFSFGAPADKSAEPKAGGFSFGAAADKPEPPKVGGFSFGAASTPAADKPAEPKAGGFSFGAAADKPAEAPKPAGGFSFGAPSTPATKADAPATAAPFSFGAKQAEAPKPTAGGFSFGAPSTSTPAADKPADKPAGGFTFGAPAPAANGNGSDKPAAGGFSFGATPAATPAAAPATAPAAGSFGTGSGFSFGKPADKPAATGFGSGSGASTPGFSFGASTPANGAVAAADKPASTGFSFGAAPAKPATPTSAGFSFGAASTPTPAPAASGGFGASTSAASPATPSFTFGKPTTGGFGSTPAAPAATSTPSFSFGASSSTPAVSGGFGTGSGFGAPAPAAGGFGTGSGFGAPAPAASTGGFGPGSGFGSAAPAAAAPAASTFTFGAPAAPSGPSTPTSANASSSFAFGSAPASNAGTPSFSFGAGASSTPSSAAPAATPFQFGAAAPAAGAAPVARFGSPAPPSAVDGFSLGVNAADPASPGARKIKPLRRGAVKR